MNSRKEKHSIYELRKTKRLTQRQVASDLGVSVSTYRKWEKDLSGVAVSKAEAIANYYGVRLGQILFFPLT